MSCPKYEYIECLIFFAEYEGIEASSPELKHGEHPGGVTGFVVAPSIAPELEKNVLDLFSVNRDVRVNLSQDKCPATLITAIKDRRAGIRILFLCPLNSHVYVEIDSNFPGVMDGREIGDWLLRTGRIINGSNRDTFYEVNGPGKIRSVFEDYGSLQIIFQLIKLNSDIHYRSMLRGTTFLHLAIEATCEPLVRCLLENNADTEKKTRSYETALQLAIGRGSPISILKILIKHGADINANDSRNPNPLILALRQESYGTDTIKFFLDSGANTDNAIAVAAVRSPEMLSCILNYRPQLDNTVLRQVIHGVSDLNKVINPLSDLNKDRIDDLNVSIDKLLEYGFDLGPDDASDVELLIGAVKLGKMELVLRLIHLGAGPFDVPDWDGWTALHEAAKKSGERMIRVLVDHGADINTKTTKGVFPLTVAAKHGNLEAFRFLLSLGAKLKENPYLLYAETCLDRAGHLSSYREPPPPNEFLLMLEYPCPLLAKDLRFDQISYIALWIKDLLEYDFLSFERIENLLESDNFDPDLNSTMTLCEHIEALMVADLSINKNLNGNEILDKLKLGLPTCSEGLTRRYGNEVTAMKEKLIEGSVISFHDVLEATLPQIVNFLYNNSIFETLKNGENYVEFPSYSGMISRRFRKAYFRKLLVDQVVKMLNILFTATVKLPFRILQKIVTYLSNQELLILSSVCKTPSDKRFIDGLSGIVSNNPLASVQCLCKMCVQNCM